MVEISATFLFAIFKLNKAISNPLKAISDTTKATFEHFTFFTFQPQHYQWFEGFILGGRSLQDV